MAIKILLPHLASDPRALARFKREAKAIAALSHPNILALHDLDSDGELHFAVMELLEGETLSRRLARQPMDWRSAVEVAAAVADGLSAAHAKSIVHRDIKPDNIFLTRDGQVKILDFGIARLQVGIQATTQTQATRPGFAVGTIGYMAPEQLRGESVDTPADLFSLGCVLHEMVTGRKLFARGTAAETAAAILTAEPPPMGGSKQGVPLELEQVVRLCLQKPVAKRFQSACNVAFALRQILQAQPQSPKNKHLTRIGWAAAVLALIVAVVLLLLQAPFRPSAAFVDSLAVLPIANQSGDPSLDYLSDGITESLINSMSQLPRVKVMARTTAFRYKGRNIDPQTAGRELKVRRIVSGKLVRQEDSLSVQVDLVNVADGSQLWGSRYQENLSDLITLPERISGRIAGTMQLSLTGSEQKRLGRRPTQDPEAYRLYLLGRHYWNRRDWNEQHALEKAIEYFQQAIDKDPLYAMAYVGLAESYETLPFYSNISARESILKARTAALKALEIDETAAEAHVTLATIVLGEWKWDDAEKLLRRAIDLKPGYDIAHSRYADCLHKTGRTKQALAEANRAYELDPLSPRTIMQLGAILTDDHQYDKAIEQFRQALQLNPNSGMAYVHVAVALVAQKKFPEAMAELDRAKTLMPQASVVSGLIGFIHAQTGNRPAAVDILRQLTSSPKSRFATALDLPGLYLGLGDKDRAFDALNRAVDEKLPLIDLLKVDVIFEPLRRDPRYAQLLRRMNLTP